MDIKVNTIIDSLEEYVESKAKILLTGNVIVNQAELLEFIKDIRKELPISLTQASAIYEDREKILLDAKTRAEGFIEDASMQAKQIIEAARQQEAHMLDSNEIVKKARLKADEIVLSAREESADILEAAKLESENMKNETFDFVEEKIAKLESTFSHAKYNIDYLKDEFEKHTSSMFNTLSSNIVKEHEAIVGNKRAFSEYRTVEVFDDSKEEVESEE